MTNQTDYELDLRGVACPLNFVKAKLFLDKMSAGQVVHVLLDPGEPLESVSASIKEEGHEIVGLEPGSGGYFCVSIRKV